MDIFEEKEAMEQERSIVEGTPLQEEEPGVSPEAPVEHQPEVIPAEEFRQEAPAVNEPEDVPMTEPQEPVRMESEETSAATPEEPVVEEQQESIRRETPQPVKQNPEQNPKKNVGFWVLAVLLVVSLLIQTVSLCGFGKNSIVSAGINDSGELILTYSDGSTDNLGVVVGADGTDGINGSNGTTTIVSSEEGAAMAISNGLRSSVSVFCTFMQEGRWGRTVESYSAGSGVIYRLDKASGDAIIVTNYHVVYDASSRQENGIAEGITVYLYGSEISGMEMEATYVGGSMYYDLAVLYVQGSDVLKNSDAVAVTVADSDAVQVGSTAIAIGNAEGSGISATSGVVSVASEYITMTASDGITSVDYRVMRIDTAVNSGNSGGGLFDQNGNLIGIVNAKTVDDGVENIGYALPSSVVDAVVNNIIDYCLGTDCENVMRPMMGVTVMTTGSRAVYDEETGLLSVVETVEIYEVSANQIGNVFQVGDVLVSASLNGTEKQLTRQYHVIDLMLTARVGDEVIFTVLRNGEEVELTVTVTQDCLTVY